MGILVEVPGNQWATVFMDLVEDERAGIHRRRIRVVVTDFNEMTAEHPDVIAVPKQCLACVSQGQKMFKERREYGNDFPSSRNILVVDSPRRRPVLQIWNVLRDRLLFIGDNGGFALAGSGLANHVADPSA